MFTSLNVSKQADLIGQLQYVQWLLRPARNRKKPGLHMHPQQGRSQEFVEYREYRPDDDSKDLDWKMYARTDRHYVKLRDTHTPITAILVLDTSASMTYRSSRSSQSKQQIALICAFALGYVLYTQGDAFVLKIQGADNSFKPRSGRKALQAFLEQIILLEQSVWQGAGVDSLTWGSEISPSKSVPEQMFLLTDGLSPLATWQRYFSQNRHQAKHWNVIQILDPQEIDPQQNSILAYNLENPQQKRPISAVDWQRYQENITAHQQQWQKCCLQNNIALTPITTTQSWDQILQLIFQHNRLSPQ